MSKNKTIVIGGTYNWKIQVGVSEDKVEELREKFGVGTYHNTELHNWDEGSEDDYMVNKKTIDYVVKQLGGTMYSQNYDWNTDIDEFNVEEEK